MQNNIDIALLALDIDGTLVTHGDSITDETKAAIHRASAAGLQVALATGRRYRTTRRVIDALNLPLPAICLSGALVKGQGGETLRGEHFAPAQIAALLDLARSHRLPLLLNRDAHATGGPDFIADGGIPWNQETSDYLRANPEAGHVDAGLASRGHQDVLQVGCFGAHAPLAALQRDIADRCGSAFASVLVESKKTPGWYLETTLGYVNKWQALRRLALDLGIATQAICAVGDSLNDVPMIRGAGFGVAMGNAAPEVKAAADWVTGSNREDGLVALVERLLG